MAGRGTAWPGGGPGHVKRRKPRCPEDGRSGGRDARSGEPRKNGRNRQNPQKRLKPSPASDIVLKNIRRRELWHEGKGIFGSGRVVPGLLRGVRNLRSFKISVLWIWLLTGLGFVAAGLGLYHGVWTAAPAAARAAIRVLAVLFLCVFLLVEAAVISGLSAKGEPDLD